MKQIIATAVLLLGSASSYAATTASASLVNIQAQYFNGADISLLAPTLASNLNVSGSAINQPGTNEHLATFYTPINAVKQVIFPGIGNGSATALIDDENYEISAYSKADNGVVNASSSVSSYFDYKANTLLLISADAFISGATDGSPLDSFWDVSAWINASSFSFENGVWESYNYSASLFANIGLGDDVATSKTLSLFYYNTVDTRLSLNFEVRTTAVVAVPEPSTYAMLGLGLGLLGVAVRRRKSA